MAGELVTPKIPLDIVETKIGLVCIDVDTTNGACKTWAVMKQPEPLLPNLSKDEINLLTMSILGFLVFVWVIVQIKRVINTL